VNVARKRFICGNWKMHRTAGEAAVLAREVRATAELFADKVDVAIVPPFTALWAAGAELAGSRIGLGAQDVFWETQGAFTGEVSAAMLVDAGCRYVLVGHSERRQFFGDTDEAVRKKTRAALTAGLHPIVCIGETLPERESGQTLEVVGRQIRAALSGLDAGEIARLTVAYEPVWAIGTGRPRRSTPRCAPSCANWRRLRPTRPGFSTGDPSSPTTPPSSCPSRTWTVLWWAERASRH
jgi:triosephosphate isomerase